MEERPPWKREVTGSNPVTLTIMHTKMDVEMAMRVAKAGGRDATDRTALAILRLEVMRLRLELEELKENK